MSSLLLLGCLLQASVAHSTTYYFCAVTNIPKTELYYYSDILVSEDRVDESDTIGAFYVENERRSRKDFHIIQTSGYCYKEYTMADIQQEYRRILGKYSGGLKYPFNNPPAPSEPYQPPTTYGSIVVDVVKPITRTPEQIAELAAQEREMANRKARSAAAAAKYDAKIKAMIAEQLRLRREQGARQ